MINLCKTICGFVLIHLYLFTSDQTQRPSQLFHILGNRPLDHGSDLLTICLHTLTWNPVTQILYKILDKLALFFLLAYKQCSLNKLNTIEKTKDNPQPIPEGWYLSQKLLQSFSTKSQLRTLSPFPNNIVTFSLAPTLLHCFTNTCLGWNTLLCPS